MSRVITPLTDTKIKKEKPKDKDYTLSDGNGLQLLVKSTGTKLWEFFYTSPTQLKRRKVSFGVYPKVGLTQAREKRTEYHKLISQGIDPKDHHDNLKALSKQKNKDTILDLLNDFYSREKEIKNLKDLTVSKDKGRFINHFINKLPKKGDEIIHNITYEKSINILRLLEPSKLTTLRKVKGIYIRFLKYLYAENIIKSTELFGKLELYTFKAPQKSEVRNNPTLTSQEDIKKLYNDMLLYDGLLVKFLMLFSIHTAQRQGSIVTAKWCDIDFDKKIWTIPKENMKVAKEHILPLSEIMTNYLKELKNLTGDGDYLFPNSQTRTARNKYPHTSTNTTRKALRRMGYTNEQQTAHGFRAMFKTVCKENQEKYNLKNEFVEMILAHYQGNQVEQVYNRAKNLDDMRIVANWWSNYLDGLKDGVK